MQDQKTIDTLSFDTWIHAMEDYRVRIENPQIDSSEQTYGEEFLEAAKAKDDPLRAAYKQAIAKLDKDFAGHPELLENAKDLLDAFCDKIMNPASPYQGVFRSWLTQTQEGKKWLTPEAYLADDGTPKSTDQIRVDLCEELGQAMLQKHQELGLPHHHSVMFNGGKPYYLVQTEPNKHVEISEDKLVQLLKKDDGPHIFMTGNHCWLESQDDLNTATKSISDLVKQATGEVKLNAEAGASLIDPNDAFAFADGSPENLDDLTQEDTLLVSAAYTCENNYLNLAQLFRRLIDIKAHVNKPTEDTFLESSPSSHLFVTTVLKTIAENPEAVQMPQQNEKKPQFIKDGERLQLREDAPESLHDLMVYAFSQGGNTLRDAMRMLVHVCEFENLDVPAGKDRESFLKKMTASISMTVAGLNEAPMVGFYGDKGAHVALITKNQDNIARTIDLNDTGSIYTHVNPILEVEGNVHAPHKFIEAIMADERTRARVMSHLAPLVGRASVSIMDYNPQTDSLQFELGPTTHTQDFEKAFETFKGSLEEKGLKNVTISKQKTSRLGRRVYDITADNLFTPEVFLHVIHAVNEQSEGPDQPLFFNCMARKALECLAHVIDSERRMRTVVNNEILHIYRNDREPLNQLRVAGAEVGGILGESVKRAAA